MFHTLSKNKTNTTNFISNINAFERFIDEEIKCRTPRSLDEIIRTDIKEGFSITFDDVSESVYNLAYPILKEKKIPFTIFVASNYIDCFGYLTRQELLEMTNDDLCTVGSHTKNHEMLRNNKELKNEILGCKKIIEKIIQKEIKYFAYPYGSVLACSFKSIRVAANSGYTAAFSTINGYITRHSLKLRYFLPRINADYLVKKYEEVDV
jgi:peptidoglycan/xylan/chitin deacetylase (PgdA/CDA1 family)